MTNYWYNTDLGVNGDRLVEIVEKCSDSVLVDLGVRTGVSSQILLRGSEERNNRVFGIDTDFAVCPIPFDYPRYTRVRGDSVSIARGWDEGEVTLLFLDTLHIKDQVMCELRYWWPHLKSECFLVFHDTCWPKGKHDVIGGVQYDRVEEGMKSFFGIDTMDYEDDYISVKTYPESWGMTIVEVKEKKDYPSECGMWDEVLNNRNAFISHLFHEDNQGGMILERYIDNV